MKVALGCDHGGYVLMGPIMEMLESKGIEYEFLGCHGERVDYPIYAQKVAKKVVDKEADLGIVACGTGVGISLAANKVEGIRCANVADCFSAEFTRLHNDANMLALGGRVVGPGLAAMIAEVFVTTPFSNEERHIRRIKMYDKTFGE